MDGKGAEHDPSADRANKRQQRFDCGGAAVAQLQPDVRDRSEGGTCSGAAGCSGDSDGSDDVSCPICLESEGELLQRGCGCRGDSGWVLVHAECIKQVATHGEEWKGWQTCGTCTQLFTGAGQHGLAIPWWATVASRDESDEQRLAAALFLANAHADQGNYAEAEKLQLEVLAVQRRVLGEAMLLSSVA